MSRAPRIALEGPGRSWRTPEHEPDFTTERHLQDLREAAADRSAEAGADEPEAPPGGPDAQPPPADQAGGDT